MNKFMLDPNSLGTIFLSWVAAAAIIYASTKFVKVQWLMYTLSVLAVVFMLFVTYFFRVPNRTPVTDDPKVVTSVADGKVVIVEKVFEKEYLQRECIQVSVYMNFFDVHVNFWPLDGTVTYYQHHPGAKHLAFLPKSSDLNEHASTGMKPANCDDEILFKQIAGTFARRIYTDATIGNDYEIGMRCGVIKFGSRLDLFLPLDSEIKVKVGDKVKAVESVIAVLP